MFFVLPGRDFESPARQSAAPAAKDRGEGVP